MSWMKERKGGAMARRDALKTLAAAGAALPLACAVDRGGAQPVARFFTVAEGDGRWWFITPDGRRFWSIGMNHIDSAALRFADSGSVWEKDAVIPESVDGIRAVNADFHRRISGPVRSFVEAPV
jgi:hypothetical protein